MAVAIIFTLIAPAQRADARARMVAVFALRSTAAESRQAAHLSIEIANVIAGQTGWDAKVIKQGTNSKGDAAAAIGAELYLSGQYASGHATLASFSTATDEKIADLTLDALGGELPKTADVLSLLGSRESQSTSPAPDVSASPAPEAPPEANMTVVPGELPQPTPTASPTPEPTPTPVPLIDVHAGDAITVVLLSNLETRTAREGDTFAVQTVADYANGGNLILPKGSPGYGVITHIKHAGTFRTDAELGFTVMRLVTPAGNDVFVQTSSPAADTVKIAVPNAPKSMLQIKMGNDILIRQGSVFHVATRENIAVPLTTAGTPPAKVDPTLITVH